MISVYGWKNWLEEQDERTDSYLEPTYFVTMNV